MSDDNSARMNRIENAIRRIARSLDDVDAIGVIGELADLSELSEPSPAQQLVGLANSLPKEVLGSEKEDAIAGSFVLNRNALNPIGYKSHDGPAMCNERHFRRWLFGVMCDFVGTEPEAFVCRFDVDSVEWCAGGVDDEPRRNKDHLTAYRDCCLAIVEKRRKG